MFKLKLKDGVEVATLEELRENFDLELVVEYFKKGELLEWLEDRFYDDEADAINEIDANDRNLTAKICAALNVECDDNLEFIQRVREKKSILSEKTDDETIIDNAVSTAINQEDLAALIQMDYKTIYLCGEQFNVPIRIAGVRYIGILGTPKIKIRAKSQEELDEKQISFENVQLPWQKAAPIEELKALAEKIFQTRGKFPIVNGARIVSTFDQLDKVEKSLVLRMICQGKYDEHQIAFMRLTKDLSSGFAMTVDSFCTGGGIGTKIFPYKGMNLSLRKDGAPSWHYVLCINGTSFESWTNGTCKKLFGEHDNPLYEKINDFLDVAKNF